MFFLEIASQMLIGQLLLLPFEVSSSFFCWGLVCWEECQGGENQLLFMQGPARCTHPSAASVGTISCNGNQALASHHRRHARRCIPFLLGATNPGKHPCAVNPFPLRIFVGFQPFSMIFHDFPRFCTTFHDFARLCTTSDTLLHRFQSPHGFAGFLVTRPSYPPYRATGVAYPCRTAFPVVPQNIAATPPLLSVKVAYRSPETGLTRGGGIAEKPCL